MNRFKYMLPLMGMLLLNASGIAQEWVAKMQDPEVNFYEVQQSFNTYWEGKEIEKGKGWKQFRRWENFMGPRVYPHGDRTIPARAMEAYMQQKLRSVSTTTKAANWSLIGPTTSIPAGGGAGRINAIRFDPQNYNILYACAPAGGIWKSTNGGSSWSTNTDQLSVIGTSDIAIHPYNSNIMYLATGDGDAGDTYSIGVLKSTDGGNSWSTTGLSWTVNQVRRISKILIHPVNPDTVLAATSNGIYRSLDGGVSWTQTSTGNFKDMEFKPGDPSVVYVSGTTFRKSTNTGGSFSVVNTGLPNLGVSRYAIAVTPDDPAYVYLLAGSSGNQGFLGFYRSTDSGTSFTAMSNSSTPNLLGWSNSGSDSGGQAWYDLAIAASPVNKNEVWVGGVNIWRTTDGGINWSIRGHWYGAGSTPYVHADHHDIIFIPGTSIILNANDGGVFKTTNGGQNWSDLSDGLQIAQMYRLSTSATNPALNLSGWQDNGSNRVNAGVWDEVYGGDGMECIIDPINANVMYVSLYYGEIFKSTNGGNSFPNTIVNSGGTGVDGNGAWVTPYILSPTDNNTIYVGKSQVYRSTNGGTSFSQVGNISGGSGHVIALANAFSDDDYIYAAKINKLWVSTDGNSFTDRTAGLPLSSSGITSIAINPTDPEEAWVTLSGYSSGNKVFHTTNAGVSWANYSAGLPNLPANTIVYQYGTSDGLYVGTDVGVYYRESGMNAWTAYNTGLPNVVVSELEIHYGSGKIRAATYGRGMWESDLYSPGNMVPITNFTASLTHTCPGTTIQFTDISGFNPTSWNWTFQGGSPATSAAQHPAVNYTTPGTYTVTLTATNANGSASETKTGYIVIAAPVSLPLAEGFQPPAFPPAGWSVENNDNQPTWERTTAAGGFGSSSASVMIDNFNDDLGTGDAFLTSNYDISGADSAILEFDVAYTYYSTQFSDSLAVYVSYDCGNTYNLIWKKGGANLATAPSSSSAFVPVSSQWRNETVLLNNLSGETSLLVKFENIGGWGNNLYVDNINIGQYGSAPVASFSANPVSICAGSSISFYDQSGNFPDNFSWTFQGGTPATSTSTNPVVTWNTPGSYQVLLTAGNNFGSDTDTLIIVVHDFPPVPVISVVDTSLMSSSPTGNQWKFFGGIIAGATNQFYTPTNGGIYSVEVTSPEGCATNSAPYTINVGIEEQTWASDMQVIPNPNRGTFSVQFTTLVSGQLQLEIFDLTGRIISRMDMESQAGRNVIPVAGLPLSQGSYLMRLSGNSGAVTRIVIVQ